MNTLKLSVRYLIAIILHLFAWASRALYDWTGVERRCQFWCITQVVFYTWAACRVSWRGCVHIQGFFLSSPCNSWVQLEQERRIIVCKGHCSNAAEEHDLNLIIKLPQQGAARETVWMVHLQNLCSCCTRRRGRGGEKAAAWLCYERVRLTVGTICSCPLCLLLYLFIIVWYWNSRALSVNELRYA